MIPAYAQSTWGTLVLLLLSAPVMGAITCNPPQPPPPEDVREPCANVDSLRQPFFGDLHVHTANSLDADLQGTRLKPTDAYDFAQGATVGIQPYDGQGNALRTLTIDRPLDFAMVSDHAEFFGETSRCLTPGSAVYDNPFCALYRTRSDLAFLTFNAALALGIRNPFVCDGLPGQACVDASATLWEETQDAAEAAYDRTSACSFTSFVGYEWTGSPEARNLHRNVVFRGKTVPELPTAFFEAPDPGSLWDALENDCQTDENPNTPDCEFLTIPHNSNLSGGTYFNPVYNQTAAARRQLHEPLAEVIQHKGQSECVPGSSTPADELCNFELLPYNNLRQPVQKPEQNFTPFPQDFIRSALKEGLSMEQNLGVNAFKYGMVGGTDTHLGTPGAVSETGFPGHGGAGSSAQNELPTGLTDLPAFNPGGLTVIWAEENSRDSLFAAMRRREVYATSGTRPIVRFFGGDLDADLCSSQTPIADAYAQGVPMGGTLVPPPPAGPKFFVHAQKDPDGVDLQRVQIIKGWVDDNGDTHEQVYEVAGDPNNGALAGIIEGDGAGLCLEIGPGFSQLCTVWTDPDFEASERAFYYARVVENPTCRWSWLQCFDAGVVCGNPETVTEGFEHCCDPSIPSVIQERAWTSPIWVQPTLLEPGFSLEGSVLTPQLCAGGAPWETTIDVAQMYGFLNPVALSVTNLFPGVTANFSPNPVTVPGQSVLQISAAASTPFSFSVARVKGTAAGAPDQTLVAPTRVYNSVPSAPTLNTPADGAIDVDRSPLFLWTFGTQTSSQTFELSQDPSFQTIEFTETALDTLMVLPALLPPYTTYYWRVRPENPCGPGVVSETSSFTTGPDVVAPPPVGGPFPGSS